MRKRCIVKILMVVACFSVFLPTLPQLLSAESSKVNLPPEYANVKIPPEHGRITEYHHGSKPFTIFYVQDAHVNIAAQKSIAKIVELLHLKRDIRLILVEGGIGDVSLTEYRVGPKEKRIEISEQLLKEGKISGEEYLNFIEDYPILLWGIESQVLYDENLIAFTKVEPLIPKVTDKLNEIDAAIRSLKPALYPKAYFDFESELETLVAKNDLSGEAKLLLAGARKKQISVADYPNLDILSKLIELEGGADFERVDYERTQLVAKLQRSVPTKKLQEVLQFEKTIEKDALKRADFYEKLIQFAEENKVDTKPFPALRSAVPYLREQDKINSIVFFKEKERLGEEIAASFLTSPDAKKLYQYSKDLWILRQLVKLELLPEDYQTYLEHHDRFLVAKWAPFLMEQAKQSGKSVSLPKELEKLDETIDSFQNFYRIANIRDQALVENLTEKIKTDREPEAVLIAGGFHKDRLIRKLLRIGFNVVVISPNVDINQGQELYRRMLKEKWENGRWYIKGEGKQRSS
ncbi:MAG: hypothetical protein HY582_04800 [Candidatus Omnitrophica bacterium]|nr:hypothetical protein [Candidatus Omnitrophota bacterium]